MAKKYDTLYNLVRRTTSIKINPDLWSEFKAHCARKRIDMSAYLENVIIQELKKGRHNLEKKIKKDLEKKKESRRILENAVARELKKGRHNLGKKAGRRIKAAHRGANVRGSEK